jgi:hypothetical protein
MWPVAMVWSMTVAQALITAAGARKEIWRAMRSVIFVG